MSSGLEVATDRHGSLPEVRAPPPQPYYQQYKQPADAQDYGGEEWGREAKKHRLPFGWSPVVFALVVGVITALIVGAVVGGGVGGSLASSKRCDDFQTL